MIKVGDLVKYSGPDGDIGIAVVVNIHDVYFDLKWVYVSNPSCNWNNDAVEKDYNIENCFNPLVASSWWRKLS